MEQCADAAHDSARRAADARAMRRYMPAASDATASDPCLLIAMLRRAMARVQKAAKKDVIPARACRMMRAKM